MTTEALPPPAVRIDVMPSYGVGLPMMVALTVYNPSRDVLYFDLPHVDWFGDPRGARWVVITDDGRVHAVGMATLSLVPSEGGGFGLDPGDAHTTLVDLAALMPDLPAGDHRLHVEYPFEVTAVSPPVVLRIEPLAGVDAEVARAVREGTLGDRTWAGFLRGDWIWQERPPFERVRPEVMRALTLPLFLHRAAYGDEDVRGLDLAALDRLDQGPLEAEAALLRHEVAHAADPPLAAHWDAVVRARWPGLVWRIERTERGFGLLRGLRDRTQRRLTHRPQDEIDSSLRP